MLKQIKTDTKKLACSKDIKDLFQTAGTQPWPCRKLRREATRATEEAFQEIDQRECLFSSGIGIVINSIANRKTPLSPHFLSLSTTLAGAHVAHLFSAKFPCLCKEEFADRVGLCVLAITMTVLAISIAQLKNDVSLSSSSSSLS